MRFLTMLATSLVFALPLSSAAFQARVGEPTKPVTIRAAVLLDGRGAELRDVVVQVERGKIVSVGRSAEPATYELSGATLMPGWIDTHAHLDPHFAANGRPTSEYSRRDPDETIAQAALYAAENAWGVRQISWQ